jgi:hypothetical protein
MPAYRRGMLTAWHEEALKETVARCATGQEQPIDWADAKRQLRKRAE